MRYYDGGSIPWNRIVEYGHHVGVQHDMIDAFVTIMRSMDDAYMSWAAEEAKRRAERPSGK